MLELLVAGALHKTSTFPNNEVSEDRIKKGFNPNDQNISDFIELIVPLTEIGREDLARAIEHKIALYLNREPGLKAWVKRFDNKYLQGNLAGFKRAIHNRAVKS